MNNLIYYIYGFSTGIFALIFVLAVNDRENSSTINSLNEQVTLLKEINQQQREVIQAYENHRISETVVSEETINFTYRGGAME